MLTQSAARLVLDIPPLLDFDLGSREGEQMMTRRHDHMVVAISINTPLLFKFLAVTNGYETERSGQMLA